MPNIGVTCPSMASTAKAAMPDSAQATAKARVCNRATGMPTRWAAVR
jgi:hypothetical protein